MNPKRHLTQKNLVEDGVRLMATEKERRPVSSFILIAVQVCLGLGAVFGGGGLMLNPSGQLIGMPVSLIQDSVFGNFFIPGLILFLVLGLLPLWVAWGLATRRSFSVVRFMNIYPAMNTAWTFSLYVGFAVIIWIMVEMFIIQEVALVHMVYAAVGIAIQVLTLLPAVQRYYASSPEV